MNFPILEPPRVLLHVIIPGEPHTWQRVGWSRGRSYDPNSENKQAFQWHLRAACPTLKPDCINRLGLRLIVWTGKMDAWNQDADNFLKAYMDFLSPTAPPRRHKHKMQIPVENQFAVWGNDRQVDEAYVRVHRGSATPKIEILVYELLP